MNVCVMTGITIIGKVAFIARAIGQGAGYSAMLLQKPLGMRHHDSVAIHTKRLLPMTRSALVLRICGDFPVLGDNGSAVVWHELAMAPPTHRLIMTR